MKEFPKQSGKMKIILTLNDEFWATPVSMHKIFWAELGECKIHVID